MMGRSVIVIAVALAVTAAVVLPRRADAQPGDRQHDRLLVNEPDADRLYPPPPQKVGTKRRAKRGAGAEPIAKEQCQLHVDNRTPWKVQVFVDERFAGVVAPWGDSLGSYDSGERHIEALAEMRDAEPVSWGPQRVVCKGEFTWPLTRK